MEHDLLFHLTTQENWKLSTSRGEYAPESLEEEGFIHCSTAAQVEEIANRFYLDTENLILLVIDPLRIHEPIKFEKAEDGNKYPHIYGPIVIDAVIDRIKMNKDNKGKYFIEINQFD